jgi:hypothetical protein
MRCRIERIGIGMAIAIGEEETVRSISRTMCEMLVGCERRQELG